MQAPRHVTRARCYSRRAFRADLASPLGLHLRHEVLEALLLLRDVALVLATLAQHVLQLDQFLRPVEERNIIQCAAAVSSRGLTVQWHC